MPDMELEQLNSHTDMPKSGTAEILLTRPDVTLD